MAPKTVKLITKSVVEKLAPNTTIRDTRVKGFCVRRQIRDASYFLDIYINGHRRILTIGRHGSPYTAEKARDAALQLLGEIKSGSNPAAAREALKGMPTVSELCDQYTEAAPTLLLVGRGRPKKPATIATDKGRIERHIKPLLGKLRVDAVTKQDIENFSELYAFGLYIVP